MNKCKDHSGSQLSAAEQETHRRRDAENAEDAQRLEYYATLCACSARSATLR